MSQAVRTAPERPGGGRGAALLALVVCCIVAFVCGASVGFMANVDYWYAGLRLVVGQ